MNYTERDIPYTCTIEHIYFDLSDKQTKAYIYKEYPSEYVSGIETILLSTNQHYQMLDQVFEFLLID